MSAVKPATRLTNACVNHSTPSCNQKRNRSRPPYHQAKLGKASLVCTDKWRVPSRLKNNMRSGSHFL